MKRLFGILLTLSVVISLMMPFSVRAESPDTRGNLRPRNEDQLKDERRVVVNPVYADCITEDQLSVLIDRKRATYSINANESTPVFSDLRSAGDYVRAMMVRRANEAISIGIDTSVYGNGTSETDILTAVLVEAFRETENPDEGDYLLFNCYGYSYTYEKDEDILYINYDVIYHTTYQQEQEVNRAVDALVQELKLDGLKNNYRILRIYDYVTSTVKYDFDHLEDEDYTLKYTAYAALMNHSAVCQGYAALVYRLCRETALAARCIAGEANGPHAWNIVKMDKLYYNLDATWDAGVQHSQYEYFLKGSDDFPYHYRENFLVNCYDTVEFDEVYPTSTGNYGYSLSGAERIINSFRVVQYDETVEAWQPCNIVLETPPKPEEIKWSEFRLIYGEKWKSLTYKSDGTFDLVFVSPGERVIQISNCGFQETIRINVVPNDEISNLEVSCGDALMACYDSALGRLTIEGEGAMYDYDNGQAPWYGIRDYILSVFIDGDVTYMGRCSFLDCDKVEYCYFDGSEEEWKNNVTVNNYGNYCLFRTFYYPPVITSQPQPVVNDIYGTATYEVKAEGKRLRYQWLYDDGEQWNEIYGAGRNYLNLLIDGDYLAGYQFKCLITDEFGNQIESEPASLTIKESIPCVIRNSSDGGLYFTRCMDEYEHDTHGEFQDIYGNRYVGLIFKKYDTSVNERLYGNINSVEVIDHQTVTVDDMDHWFEGQYNLKYADLSGFKVTGSMKDTFKDCPKLKAVNFGTGLREIPVVRAGKWENLMTGEVRNHLALAAEYDPDDSESVKAIDGWWLLAEEFNEAFIQWARRTDDNNVTLTIRTVDNADRYEIWVSREGNAYQKLGEIPADQNYYVHKNVQPGVLYRYVVKTVYEGIITMESNYHPFIIVPTPKIKVTPLSATRMQITVTNPARDDVSYEFRRAGSSDMASYSIIGITPETTFINNNAEPGLKYYYQVSAKYNDQGSTYHSESASVAGQTTLTKPEITVTQSGNNQTTVSIVPVEGAQRYQIQRSASAKKGYKTIGETSEITFDDASVIPGKKNYYRVRAVGSNYKNEVFSAYSSYKSVKITIETPKLIEVMADLDEWKLTADWSDNRFASRYQLYQSTRKKKGYKLVGTYDESTGDFLKTVNGKNYYFKVRAVYELNGKKYYSSYSNILIGKLTLANPVLSTVRADDPDEINKVTLSFGEVPAATGYQIYRSTRRSGGFKQVGICSTAEYVDHVKPGQTYYYRVRAFKEIGPTTVTSGYSGIKSVKVSALSKPANLILSLDHENRAIMINWDENSQAQGYEVQWSLYKNKKLKSLGETTGCNRIFQVPSTNKTYYLKVRSFYTDVTGMKYYSAYSSVKSIKAAFK